jgi:glycerate dehydrogenase
MVARCQGAEVVLTNKALLDARTLKDLPALRYVGVTATGVNPVDVAQCSAQGIAVTNVPAYSAPSVAQMVVAMVLHFATGVAAQDARVKAGDWARSPDFCLYTRPMVELAGKVAVIVGWGAIGRAAGHALEALGMEVVAAQVPGTPPRPDRMALAAALPRAQVVSLHCPLTEQTLRMVDAAFLAALRPGAWLVNTARGGLVAEAALLSALREGRLGGVALDVLGQEPPPVDHPLLDPAAPFRDRVLVTPHIAWGTDEARKRLVDESIANVQAWVRGERRNRVES